MAQKHVVLEGGARPAMPDAKRVRDLPGDSPVTVTLTLRGPELPKAGRTLTADELERSYSASADDVAAVRHVLEGFDLKIERESALARSVTVSGAAAQIEKAFQPEWGVYHTARLGEFRGREGEVKIPAPLDGLVTGVFGLDQRRVAGRRHASASPGEVAGPGRTPLSPADLERRYRFPAAHRVHETIAIAEFGGGFFEDDLAAFCDRHGRPAPRVTVVPLDLRPMTRRAIAALPAAQQQDALGESREVTMDVEIVAGLCPGAHIVIYFATFDQKGWVDLCNAVITATPAPVVLSVSWGLAEDGPGWSDLARKAINERLQVASVMGITVCAAAGDDGASDEVHDGRAHVHFPASSPFVLAVGGTMIDDADEERVWWEDPGEGTAHGGASSGGGVSVKFPRPAWQTVQAAPLNPDGIDGRVVPDVAALAGAPLYDLVVDGASAPTGGTSAATPLWASLVARITAVRRPKATPAFLAPLLYEAAPPGSRKRGQVGCTDITRGCNKTPHVGGYKAQRGYDAVSGWGVPDGQALLRCL
jgi:kumamolisin